MDDWKPIVFLVCVFIGAIGGWFWQGVVGAIAGLIVGAVVGVIILRFAGEAGL